ncbi:ABC transporter permease [Thermophilibacter provencensis]|uniref:ABC transporter permease n=1 Tax=Thermophilibacter provencensis TaxID=1852386 RepID=A0ABT7V1L8_9ACTN|nr:ABC transporter permease [Thermophilibacter provencensis]MDM8270493.1 ABC transporter permease [Thermophilibacter provencensis]
MNHNVFTRFTVRSLRANRVRTTVTIVGVALATGLLMAVLASVTSLHAAIVNYMRSIDGVWQESFDYTDDATLGNLRTLAGDHLDRLATRRDLGAVALSEENAEYAGAYLGIYDLPAESASTPRAAGDTDYAVYPAPELDEGRLPEKPGEIALPAYLRGETLVSGASQLSGVNGGATSAGEIELGSEVTLAAGRRVWASEPQTPIKSGALFQVEYSYETGEDGSINEGETVLETLADVGEARTYTVVGFVSTSYQDGNVAYVSPDEPAMTASGSAVGNAFFSTTGYTSENELDQLMVRLLGEDGSWATNSSLLTYQGLDTGRQITTSLVLFAGVLAAVIVVAAVSLISNAFRISISERTRQFGLLASLGASRRQLRRTVYVEAGIIGLIGIPIGVALGIGGAAVAFALTAEGWSMIVGNGVTVGLVLRPLDAVAAIALGILALLVSALAPSLRASRVSAVDAIRQSQDVRPSRRLLRVFRRRHTAMDDFSANGRRPRGMAARLGGMPAFLARRTLAVSAGKSRAAAMALAVSVALLVTAGLVSDYLRGTTSYIDYGGSADMQMWVSMSETSSELADSPAAVNVNDITADIAKVSGVKEGSASGLVRTYGSVHVDPAGVNWDAVDAYDANPPNGSCFKLDRNGYGSADFYLVDDATWRALASDLGLSGDATDPEHVSCVAFNRVSVKNGSTYGAVEPFTGSDGTLDVLLPDLKDNQWLAMSDDGSVYGLLERDEKTNEVTFVSPASDLGLKTMSVPVVAYTDNLGESFPIGSAMMDQTTGLTLVMPASAVFGSELEGAMSTSIIQYFASFAEGADENAVIEGIQKAHGARGDIDTVTINNLRESLREYNAMIFTVNVFLYCFIAITMAIAVANVFNTIASGLMLRTREFATLQSVGMGRRAFRRMIFLECADFAVKGLVGGVALATLVNWGFFAALSNSVSTLAFEMPWGHVALAFAVVAVVLAASAGYALHKTHALNLVEALRADVL